MRTDTPLHAEPALRKICPAAATLPFRDPPRCDGPPFAGSAPPLRRSVFCRICPAAAIHLPQKQKSERFCGAAEVAEIRQGGVTTCSVIALWGTSAARARKSSRSEEAAEHAVWTQNAFAPAIGLISNLLRFHSRYYRNETVLLLGLRIFTFWLVRLRRYLPHDLFSLGTTCDTTCSFLALSTF